MVTSQNEIPQLLNRAFFEGPVSIFWIPQNGSRRLGSPSEKIADAIIAIPDDIL